MTTPKIDDNGYDDLIRVSIGFEARDDGTY